VYATWVSFTGAANVPGARQGKSFWLCFPSVLSWLPFLHCATRISSFYTISAVWLAELFLLAASLSWLTYAATVPFGLRLHKQTIAFLFFGLAACAGAYAIITAFWVRVRRISVKLPNLPESWHGRVAALQRHAPWTCPRPRFHPVHRPNPFAPAT
jgi:hypothetical protein